ncbi:hypothetical protein F5Y16DRAFT_112376 [Xylariaceae sp. FL0255]|nr:hypothetical protein F5Y16DRAFT_112376 [Xylariaceae sp. FL0255]
MSDTLLDGIEHKLDSIGRDLWKVDGPDDALDKVLDKLLLLRAQVEVQKTLQTTANLLRRQPSDKALPKQQATKVKHLIRFVFREETRGGDRHKQLRDLDCDALKLCALSYTTEDMVKMENAKFTLLQSHAAEFLQNRKLSGLLYRTDVDKAVDAELGGPVDELSFDKFMRSHMDRRLSNRKRKYDAITSPSQVAQVNSQVVVPGEAGRSPDALRLHAKNAESASHGDVFALTLEDARYAISSDQGVRSIFLTNPSVNTESSFLTAWVSQEMGTYLGGRGQKLDYKYTLTKGVEGVRREV